MPGRAAWVWLSGGIGAAALCLVSAGSCSKAATSTADPSGTITIGFIDSLTGDQGQVGVPLKTATQVAEWQLNAIGGVLGQHVAYSIVDDGTVTTQTTSFANQFIQQGVAGVLGPASSNQVNAVQGLLYKAKTIEISATATSPAFNTVQPLHDRYFFRTIAPSDRMALVVSRFAALGPKSALDGGVLEAGADAGVLGPPCTTLQIVNAGDSFGQPFADAVRADFMARGGAVLPPIVIGSTVQASYAPQVQQLIAATPKADCAALLMFEPAAAQFMLDFKKATSTDASRNWSTFSVICSNSEYSAKLVTDSLNNPSDPTSGTAAEGAYGVYVDPTPATPEYSQFANLYASMFQVPLGQPVLIRSTANEYDAAVLIALAVEQAGGTSDRVKLRDALYSVANPPGHAFGPADVADAISYIKEGQDIDYTGASGPVDLDDCGNVQEDFIIWRVVGGQFETIERVPATSIAAIPCVPAADAASE